MTTNCTIFNQSFLQDLYPFNIEVKDDKYSIIYDIDGRQQSLPVSIKISSLNTQTDTTFWSPIFIDQITSQIQNKLLFAATSADAPGLGIESFMSFEPKFQNWLTQKGKMNIDWILTSEGNPFATEYGIMCWARRPEINSKNKYTIYDIPHNSTVYSEKSLTYISTEGKLVSVDANTKLIKKNNDVLLIVDQDLVNNSNVGVRPNVRAKYIILSEFLSQSKDTGGMRSIKDIFFLVDTPPNQIYISPGECYSYFDSDSVKFTSVNEKMPSKTYLSPILSENYRQIYHHLTLNYPKNVDMDHIDKRIPLPLFDRKTGRLFKKLCYALSTHPELDRTTFSVLQNPGIQKIVDNYISSYDGYDTEQQKLVTTLKQISSYFVNMLSHDQQLDMPNYLPMKLLEKYGAKLRFDADGSSLTYKTRLTNGPHVKVTSDIQSLCNRNLKNQVVYNNTIINVGPFFAETVLGNNQSMLKIGSTLSKENSLVPLWDIKKKELIPQKALFTVGPDIIVDWNTPRSNRDYEFLGIVEKTFNDEDQSGTNNRKTRDIHLRLTSAKFLFEQQYSALDGVDIDIEWRRISGTDCLKFGQSTENMDTFVNGLATGNSVAPGSRSSVWRQMEPEIYIRAPGRYVLECKISTPYGKKIDTLVIHVVDPKLYQKDIKERVRKSRDVNLLSNDNNIIMIPNFREFAFGKQGIFWIIYSDLSLYDFRTVKLPNDNIPGLLITRTIGNKVEPLGSMLNKFLIPYDRDTKQKQINDAPSIFSITFMCNNTVVELSQMILTHLYSEKTPNCETIYRETFDDQLADLDLSPDRTAINPITKETVDVKRPHKIKSGKISINTDELDILGPLITSSNNIINLNAFNYSRETFSDSDPDLFDPPNNKQVKLNLPVICHEVIPDELDELNKTTTTIVNKGYFHPFSGWLDYNEIKSNPLYNNATSIIAGDGYKKHCKTFKGLGFDVLKNDFIDGEAQVYSSSITLQLAEEAQECGYQCEDPENSDKLRKEYEKMEISDHDTNRGYRDLGSLKSTYKSTDEFRIDGITTVENSDNIEDNLSADYCNTTEDFTVGSRVAITYTYQKPGPLPLQNKDKEFPRFDRGFGRAIGDLEIKLNFLNYMNPKELAIWLTVQGPSEVQNKLSPTKNENTGSKPAPADILYFNGLMQRESNLEKIKQLTNNEFKKYLFNLFDMNDNFYSSSRKPKEDPPASKKQITAAYPTYHLFLLNQDHIEQPILNRTIKFTDTTTKNNSNINVHELISANNKSTIISDNTIELKPTKSSPGYSDNDIYLFNQATESNKLTLSTCSTLSKFNGMPLFANYSDANKPPPNDSSRIVFSLHIAVLGEVDENYQYDRVVNTDSFLNISNVKARNLSNIPANSLCNWEIVLSNSQSPLNFEDKDAYGLIDYTNDTPKYYGYNFIGKIKPQLIPPVNINAPNNYLIDTSQCFYSKERSMSTLLLPAPSLNFLPTALYPFSSIVGALSEMSSIQDQMNQSAAVLFSFFNDLRRQMQAQRIDRDTYFPNFDKYPIGRSEKALVSISTDGALWFKLEAGILKYSNCPVLDKPKLNYQIIHYLSELDFLAKFSLNDFTQNPLSLLNIKTINIDNIYSNIVSNFNFSIDTLKIYLNLDIVSHIKNIILKLETKIDALNSVINLSISDSEKLTEYKRLLSEYIKLYQAIWPEGLLKHKIIKFTSVDQDIVNVKYYTVILEGNNSNTLQLLEISTLGELCNNNPNIFIHNNVSGIAKYFDSVLLNTSQSLNKDTTKIVSIKGLRAYSAYDRSAPVEIFIPKTTLSDRDNLSIGRFTQESSRLQSELSKDSISETRKKQIRERLKEIKQGIFLLLHTKETNTILDKGYVTNSDGLFTIFVMEKAIKVGSILVISPNNPRVIIFDNEYTTIDARKNEANYWGLVTNNTINDNIITNIQNNLYNPGIYGSGAKTNRFYYMYSAEIINHLRNLAEYIDIQNSYGYKHEETCVLEENNQNDIRLSKLFLFDATNHGSSELKKYDNIQIIDTKPTNEKSIFDTLKFIMDKDEYSSYFRESKLRFVLEASISDISNLSLFSDSGNIVLKNNLTTKTIMNFSSHTDRQQVLTRIDRITIQIANQQKVLDSPGILDQVRSTAKNMIAKLRMEYNRLNYYIDQTKNNKQNILPHIVLDVEAGSDGEIIINETPNNDHYIINIDAEQGCSIDWDRSVKILYKMTYVCYGVAGAGATLVWPIDNFRFCGRFYSDIDYPDLKPPNEIITKYGYKITQYLPGEMQYTMTDSELDRIKAKYPNILWQDKNNLRTFSRTFYLNGAGGKSQIVKATYEYIMPVYDSSKNKPPISQMIDKVRYICNLDEVDNLQIEFKRIARNIRDVDTIYDKHLPRPDGTTIKNLAPSPGGPIDNTYRSWKCYNLISKTDGMVEHMKWANLMKYLAFYNNHLINNPHINLHGAIEMLKVKDEFGFITYDFR